MEIKYYSCKTIKNIPLINETNSYFNDRDICIDIIGIREHNGVLTDFLFNVIFITNKYKDLFKNFKEETPNTPIRQFFL